MTHTVNELLERFTTFDGRLTEVVGLLAWRFENQSLEHAVWAERTGRSKLWLEADEETPVLDAELLTRWDGKRVIVTGREVSIAQRCRRLNDCFRVHGCLVWALRASRA